MALSNYVSVEGIKELAKSVAKGTFRFGLGVVNFTVDPLDKIAGGGYASNQYINQLAGTEKAAHARDYADSMKMIDQVTEFKTLLDAREAGFNGIKVGDKTLKDLRITAPDQVADISEGVGDAESLVEKFEVLNQFLKDPANLETDREFLLGTLQEYKEDAIKAITVQNTADLATLEAKFATKPAEDAARELGIPVGDLEKEKSSALKALAASQKTALDQFTKDMEAKLTLSHANAQKERDRVSYLAMLYENNKKMRKVIDKLHDENKGLNEARNAQATIKKGIHNKYTILFSGIEIKHLPLIATLTGKKITINKNGKGDVESFSINVNSGLGELFSGSRRQTLTELTSVAMAGRACGWQTIQFDITDIKDPKHAQEAASKIYEACRLAGYKDEEIYIKLLVTSKNEQGHTKKDAETYSASKEKDKEKNDFTDKLFRGPSDGRYAKIQEQSKHYDDAAASQTKEIKPAGKDTTDKFKKTLQEYKAQNPPRDKTESEPDRLRPVP